MNRRTFVGRASLAAVAVAFVPSRFLAFAAEDELLRALRGRVGVFTGRKGGTIGWFVGADGVAVVDTQFPESAKTCLDAVRAKTARKIDAVINTHHHADHTAGNGVFKEAAARIVAHRNVPGLQKAAAEKRGNLDLQVYADTLFDDTWSLELGDETVRGRYLGPAHTGGDAIWHFEKANVAHAGDLVFRKMVPFIDKPGGASVRGWIAVLEKALKTYPKDTQWIYGHASEGNDVVGGAEGLAAQRDYFNGLLDYVAKGKKAGKSVEELAKVERIPGFEDVVATFDGAIKVNVEAAWSEV